MSNDHHNIMVAFPSRILKKMRIEKVIPSPLLDNGGIAILSKKRRRAPGRLVRIFSVEKNNNIYILLDELHHFIFSDEPSAQRFIEQLSHMSAIELMFIMKNASPLGNFGLIVTDDDNLDDDEDAS